MFDSVTTKLLQKNFKLLPIIICQRSLARDLDDVMATVFSREKLLVVADINTDEVLGKRVFSALKSRFEPQYVLLKNAEATQEAVDYIRAHTHSCGALVAVGSGTVNDLCKYAAYLDGKPYVVFPTAASMNGYLSANASITVDGYKQTVKAQMPKAVFCDISVIASAPERLNKSGLGDSLARPTAQFDWLLSHILFGTPYNSVPFELLEPIEGELFDSARGIAMGDSKCIELLMKSLLLSGLGMSMAGGSFPASQAEHMVAHAMGMLTHRDEHKGLAGALPNLHGEEIGVTTLVMARIQEQWLRQTEGGGLRSDTFPHDKIVELFGQNVATKAKEAYQNKLDLKQSGNANIEQLQKIMISPAKLEAILTAAQAPTTIEALGWQQVDFNHCLTYAKFLRDRFTILDVAL
jgi:glycerol-1-phosphate dehydrogenase [NAD(P)+]